MSTGGRVLQRETESNCSPSYNTRQTGITKNTQAREAEMICSYCFRCFIPVVATHSANLCAPLVVAAS